MDEDRMKDCENVSGCAACEFATSYAAAPLRPRSDAFPNAQAASTGFRRSCRIFLSGGKSSIRKVVFEKMAPTDTLFIDKSSKASDDEDFK